MLSHWYNSYPARYFFARDLFAPPVRWRPAHPRCNYKCWHVQPWEAARQTAPSAAPSWLWQSCLASRIPLARASERKGSTAPSLPQLQQLLAQAFRLCNRIKEPIMDTSVDTRMNSILSLDSRHGLCKFPPNFP
ncbi:MAG: hypothetical protein TE42_07775 [Candidatus Synechococcus spongiarum SP3]|uniref:Uncharacterized protein n=1 Tax=Candidatus Synechococcus spongiarum SP3 TaxID=1604020 RepID=A0A0G2HK09_9SYNE|nr:MAG: hypothetical protein TE42_07775 [Candidatus Synechococcus spongiarum SP3]